MIDRKNVRCRGDLRTEIVFGLLFQWISGLFVQKAPKLELTGLSQARDH